MRVAAIVPTSDDDVALEQLLSHLTYLDPGPDDVIVADGAASRATEMLCRRYGATWLPTRSGKGGQLALGAARARANVLWFLQSECEPHADAVLAIRSCVTHGATGGFFRFQFGGATSFAKRVVEFGVALRSRLGMIDGDQGMFMTREAYAASPGFAIQPVFEQVALVRSLQRTRCFVGVPLPVCVSPRGWEREGYFRRSVRNRVLSIGFLCGVAPAKLARWSGTRLCPATLEIENPVTGHRSPDTGAAGKH